MRVQNLLLSKKMGLLFVGRFFLSPLLAATLGDQPDVESNSLDMQTFSIAQESNKNRLADLYAKNDTDENLTSKDLGLNQGGDQKNIESYKKRTSCFKKTPKKKCNCKRYEIFVVESEDCPFKKSSKKKVKALPKFQSPELAQPPTPKSTWCCDCCMKLSQDLKQIQGNVDTLMLSQNNTSPDQEDLLPEESLDFKDQSPELLDPYEDIEPNRNKALWDHSDSQGLKTTPQRQDDATWILSGAEGKTLYDNLKIWCEAVNWNLRWKADVDYAVEATATFEGALPQAVRELIDAYKDADVPLQARIHPKQKLIVIERF